MKKLGPLIVFLGVWFAGEAAAHMKSHAYYKVSMATSGQTSVTMDLDLRDIHAVIPLDADGNGAITWAEVVAKQDPLQAFASGRLALDESCEPLHVTSMMVQERLGAKFLHFGATTQCRSHEPTISYVGFLELDGDHAGLVHVETPTGERSAVLTASNRQFEFADDQVRTAWWFGLEGVWHIFIGFDHILFLALLLLPTVLARTSRPPLTLAFATRNIIWVVSAFTVGHSITLGLAASQTFTLPVQIVEPAIALTIVLAAINNVVPFLSRQEVWIAGLFGTIHGFGFASVLGELSIGASAFWTNLLSFNLGVEIGQILIVAALLPALWYLRRFAAYRKIGIPATSLAAAILAVVWFFQRI